MSMTLLWMLINMLLGIKLGYLFLDGEITIWHGVFYLWLVGSFIALIIYIRRKWKEVPKFDVQQHDL